MDETIKLINKWFDLKYDTYDNLEYDGSIYLYYKGEIYADIRIIKSHKLIVYKSNFYEEFSNVISINYFDFNYFISRWIEKKFNLIGLVAHNPNISGNILLKVPLI